MAKKTPSRCSTAADANSQPLSVFDLFQVGLGPSSSHTVGPLRAGRAAAIRLENFLASQPQVTLTRIRIELFGSLGATGRGHATDRAVICGLEGHRPDQIQTAQVDQISHRVFTAKTGIHLPSGLIVPFDPARDLCFSPFTVLPYHTNALTIKFYGSHSTPKTGIDTVETATATAGTATAEDAGTAANAKVEAGVVPSQSDEQLLYADTYYSIGGGFVMHETGHPDHPQPCALVDENQPATANPTTAPYPFSTGAELLAATRRSGLSVAEVVRANEEAYRTRTEVDAYLDLITDTMLNCITDGCRTEGTLPGGLQVRRRAQTLQQQLLRRDGHPATGAKWAGTAADPFRAIDWVNLWALAVNEENAAGHRVVTAPTNGAAGVIPAVLGYLLRFCWEGGSPAFNSPVNSTVNSPVNSDVNVTVNDNVKVPASATVNVTENTDLKSLVQQPVSRKACRDFLLAATAVGTIIKTNASIAGAEVGCQGEIGSAASMAAAGLAQVLGATPQQLENAAEIAMEHHLGLTCDPVGGLVQIPCIERNAIAAVKAINAARMSLWGDGRHTVSLDAVVATMAQTGRDMNSKYKETSLGGLAVSVVEC